jgi:hypothetical protein
MINSAADKDFDLSFHDGLAFIHDKAQGITVAVPTTNIPQMQLLGYGPSSAQDVVQDLAQDKPLSNIEKARLAKAAKASVELK